MTHLRLVRSAEPVPSCSGPCSQGDRPCPHPQACVLPDDNSSASPVFRYFLIAVAIVAACIGAVVLSSHN